MYYYDALESVKALSDYITSINDGRKAIIEKSRSLGYLVPSDEERGALGALKLCEIKNWLNTIDDTLVKATTIDTNRVVFDSKLLEWDTNNDLSIFWGDGSISSVYAISQLPAEQRVIVHNYSTTGQWQISAFSPSKMDQFAEFVFNDNDYFSYIKCSNTMSQIKSGAFFSCSNMKNISLDPNLTYIGANAFYGCALLEEVTIPDSVTRIDGGGSFYNCPKLSNININTSSNLAKLVGNQIFATGNGVNAVPLYIPKNCVFYDSSSLSNTYETYNPYTVHYNPFWAEERVINIDSNNRYYKSINGMVYLKDASGNPYVLMHVPSNRRYFIEGSESKVTLPSTVKYLQSNCFANYTQNTDESLDIGSGIEYIHPQFSAGWSDRIRLNVTDNTRYRNGDNGELLTWSKEENIGVTDPDVIVQIPSITCDNYYFPDSMSSLVDFKGNSCNKFFVKFPSISIKNIYINKCFPDVSKDIFQGEAFRLNPANSFYADADCERYSVYDNCLYKKSGDNPYAIICVCPKKKTTITIHPDCTEIYPAAFYGCTNLTGTFSTDIPTVGFESTFRSTHYTNFIFGDDLVTASGGIPFHSSYVKTIQFGRTSASKLTTLNFSQSGLYGLSAMAIYSPNIKSISLTMFTNCTSEKTIYIPYWKSDGVTHTDTYNAFVNRGYSPTTRNNVNAILKPIEDYDPVE